MIGVAFTRIYAFWISVVLAIGGLGYLLSIILPDFPKVKLIDKITDPMIGKMLTKYFTTGCQAQNIHFDWTGKIVEQFRYDQYKDLLFYKVEIKNADGKIEHRTVPSWYILQNDNGEYEIYD